MITIAIFAAAYVKSELQIIFYLILFIHFVMKQYECTFIIEPVLSGDEIKQTAEMYFDHLKNNKCEIVHIEDWGIRQLTFPMNKRTSGAYFTVEFKSESGSIIAELELAFRRDERVLRYLTISLDKHGVKYNQDKRAGLIGKKKEKQDAAKAEEAAATKTEA
jgi:small subunit ribosomal protein S6